MDLARVRKHALTLPEATEEPHFQRTSFRVRGKMFATALPGEPFLHVFVGEEARDRALTKHPDCVEVLKWGKKEVGLRIDLEGVRAEVVKDLVTRAWEEKAPSSLLRELGGAAP